MTKRDGDDPSPVSEEYLRAHTVGELKPLFASILVVEYDPEWPRRYQEEAEKIWRVLSSRVLLLEHVGSTAVPHLPAKPIIDILLVVADSAAEVEYVSALEQAGYHLRIREPNWYEHRLFKPPGKGVNLHVFSAGCPEIDRMLVFRDRLRSNPDDRELYAHTKRLLAGRPWKYTQDYADAKTPVVNEILSRAVRKL